MQVEGGDRKAKCTMISELELRNGHGYGLELAVADADVARLDASFFGSSSDDSVKLKWMIFR